MSERKLTLVEQREFKEIVEMFHELRRSTARQVHHLMIGAIVTNFTNADIARLTDYLNAGELYTLRRLGVLAPEQGDDR